MKDKANAVDQWFRKHRLAWFVILVIPIILGRSVPWPGHRRVPKRRISRLLALARIARHCGRLAWAC